MKQSNITYKHSELYSIIEPQTGKKADFLKKMQAYLTSTNVYYCRGSNTASNWANNSRKNFYLAKSKFFSSRVHSKLIVQKEIGGGAVEGKLGLSISFSEANDHKIIKSEQRFWHAKSINKQRFLIVNNVRKTNQTGGGRKSTHKQTRTI